MNDEGKKPTASPSIDASSEAPRRRRRHGYRGYPVRPAVGGVHFGRGFSGIEPLGAGSGILPRAGILTESSKRDASAD